MFIPGFIIAWVTFPGVIVHEMAHQLFCYLFGIPVYGVSYFRFGNPAGYVIHGPARRPWHSVMAAIGPFFVNTITGALIAFPASVPVLTLHAGTPVDYVLLWLGVSIAMHSFPSRGDAANIWITMKGTGVPLHTKVWAYPVVVLIYIGAVGSMFWLDAIYGVTVASLLPNWLIQTLA